ncbi:PepSY-associated TM helix domain-containing protein [Swingsia samuiensis]|uniref:PepSY domain-containing protein n=1 Tax=Swingsia samuiensis TaxID=1293412 RepID=A0A4Y6UIF8_9PROT|nr:PepSY-associated TM helix domain-containing protein [Swingsia samuiensis]QDH17373.1 hypothetical protein E3D00_07215 [Swingsia samuiensis]
MSARHFFYIIHRYLGLIVAPFLIFAGLTGTILAYRSNIDELINPDLFISSNHPSNFNKPPITKQITKIHQRHPAWIIKSFSLNTAPNRNVRSIVQTSQGEREVFWDPYNEEIHGIRSTQGGFQRHNLMQGIHIVHYTLGGGRIGRWLMGGAAFVWLVLTLAGMIITFPPKYWSKWFKLWLIKRRSLQQRPMIELHRLLGLWTFIAMLILSSTSVAMNFFTEFFAPEVEMLSPPRLGGPFSQKIFSQNKQAIDYEAALKIARKWARSYNPQFAPVAFQDFSEAGVYGVSFASGGTSNFVGTGRRTCFMNRYTGEIIWIDSPELDGSGTELIRSLYPLHTGQIIGSFGKALDAFTGIITIILSITGIWIWYRKRCRRLYISRLDHQG